ncbi:hypothetical protein [Defluviitalea phaphyphila]|uniref:hypothetical protein n=1 Tax=Defluviitalea phaphyphila TaxID=1473580 RepID=UPI0007306C5A|nr:hypothetical protein [Defluviitalea phaphyphila]
MKLKSNNKYYILGIIPLTIIVLILSLILSYGKVWIFYPILFIGTLVIYQLFKKFIYLPRPLKEYTDLKPINLELPIKYDVEYFSSKDLDKYSFLVRNIEILSPLYMKSGEKLKVVISENLLKSKSKKFIKIAVCREIEKYRRKSLVKIVLSFVMPALILAIVILGGLVLKIELLDYFNPMVAYFILPFLVVSCSLIYLFFWNKYISYEETKLDLFLTSYFNVNDVEKYINEIEKLEGREEKTKYKEFNNYYANQRIKRLRNLK